MKFILTTLILSLTTVGFGQKKLKAYLDSKQFYAPTIGNYIEFNLQFVGYSIEYTAKENGLIGEVGISMTIKNEQDSIIASDAYRLASPFMKDSIVEDFYDIRRFPLSPGNYQFEITLQDMNSTQEPMSASQTILIEDFNNAITISDIGAIETATPTTVENAFYKSGYSIIPRLATFYPDQLNAAPVYFEVYNTQLLDENEFAIKQTIVDLDKQIEMENYTTFSRHQVAPVVPVLKNIDIESLPSGNYSLKYTLINRNMLELSVQEYTFERSKKEQSALTTEDVVLDPSFQASITSDSLGYYLESLIPISSPNEVRNIIKVSKTKDAEKVRKYIQRFWAVTSPNNTYDEWIKYKNQVQFVEKIYSNNFQEGFETDRGRVYLQYGSPTNIIQREVSTSEYPYEIWQYNKIGRFSNKRFIFYNPDLVNNAYRLLHSDMIGELKNPAWPRELAKRNSGSGNIDDPNAGTQDSFGRNSDDFFRQY